MEKTTTQYRCVECGESYLRWQGQCQTCQNWNTLQEETIVVSTDSTKKPARSSRDGVPIKLSEVDTSENQWIPTRIGEVDQLLGGGLVRGAVMLLGGEPGIGKSTLSLQIALHLAQSGQKVLYISAEESEAQIALRAQRIRIASDNLLVYSQVDMSKVLGVMQEMSPDVVILDSIQVVFHPYMPSAAGSINQVRYCAAEFIQWVKKLNCCGILIGHITKDGTLAGPKVLEHMVDVTLFFEGDHQHQFRVLRCIKNRYASTQEVGIFKMAKEGLMQMPHSSDLFLGDHLSANPGSMIVPILEGSRVLLVEIQALVLDSGYGMARRNFVGVDTNRAHLLIAALEKQTRLKLGAKDIFLNIIGGMKIKEPALDLGIALAIVSSLFDQKPSQKIGVMGEIGLTGEIRPISEPQSRLNALEKMGFTACILPEKSRAAIGKKNNITLHFVEKIQDALRLIK